MYTVDQIMKRTIEISRIMRDTTLVNETIVAKFLAEISHVLSFFEKPHRSIDIGQKVILVYFVVSK